MEKIEYKRSSTDEVVVDEGKVYCVKTPWEPVEGSEMFSAKAVEEGVELMDGKFPAVELEVFKREDGSWEVNGVWGPEQVDETGGEYGYLVWSEEKGFEYDYYGCTSCLTAEA